MSKEQTTRLSIGKIHYVKSARFYSVNKAAEK